LIRIIFCAAVTVTSFTRTHAEFMPHVCK